MSQSGNPAQPTPGLPLEQDSSLLPPLSEGDTRLNPTNTTPVLQGTTPTMRESSPLIIAPRQDLLEARPSDPSLDATSSTGSVRPMRANISP
jgi:hypothetical protein